MLSWAGAQSVWNGRPRSYLVSVVGPRPELHVAVLLVEREPLHVDLAGGLVDRGRLPDDLTRVREAGLRHQGDLVLPVGTSKKNTI